MAEELDPDFETDLQTRFPDLYHLANLFPDLKTLMIDALSTDPPMEPSAFQSKLTQTNWWKSRSDSKRRWDVGIENDPGQAARRREERRRVISSRASVYGITIGGDELDRLVESSLAWDYSDQELSNSILGVGQAGSLNAGSLTASADEVMQLGRDYLMNVNEADAQSLAIKISRGEMTLDGIKSQFKTQASQSFPQFGSALQDGFSIVDATAGVRSHVASILEISADEVDFNNDRWTDLIDHVDDSGNRRMMTKAESGRWARKQAGYADTDQSRTLAMNLVSAVGKTMGKRA